MLDFSLLLLFVQSPPGQASDQHRSARREEICAVETALLHPPWTLHTAEHHRVGETTGSAGGLILPDIVEQRSLVKLVVLSIDSKV